MIKDFIFTHYILALDRNKVEVVLKRPIYLSTKIPKHKCISEEL